MQAWGCCAARSFCRICRRAPFPFARKERSEETEGLTEFMLYGTVCVCVCLLGYHIAVCTVRACSNVLLFASNYNRGDIYTRTESGCLHVFLCCILYRVYSYVPLSPDSTVALYSIQPTSKPALQSTQTLNQASSPTNPPPPFHEGFSCSDRRQPTRRHFRVLHSSTACVLVCVKLIPKGCGYPCVCARVVHTCAHMYT